MLGLFGYMTSIKLILFVIYSNLVIRKFFFQIRKIYIPKYELI